MLHSILKIEGIEKLEKSQQKHIKGSDHLNTDRSPCTSDQDCSFQHICCAGACFNPSIAWEMPHC